MQKASPQELSTVIGKTPSAMPKAQTSSSSERPQPECAQCGDSSWLTVGGRLSRCPCHREKIIRVSLPPKYHEARLADFSRELSALVLEWAANRGEGLFVTGPTGCGKTHLAAGIVRAQLEIGAKASFRRASELYAAVRASYGADGDLAESAIMSGYCGVPLLVLDDLAAGSLSDHERRIALEVLDRRGNDQLPTVVTSNWTIQEIATKMDERIASRLSAYQVIGFKGADRRKRK